MAALLDNTTVRADGSSAEASVPLTAPDDAAAWAAYAEAPTAGLPPAQADTPEPQPISPAIVPLAAAELAGDAAATPAAEPYTVPPALPPAQPPAAPVAPVPPVPSPAQGNAPSYWAPPPLAPPGSTPIAPPAAAPPPPAPAQAPVAPIGSLPDAEAHWGEAPEAAMPGAAVIGPQLQPAPDEALFGAPPHAQPAPPQNAAPQPSYQSAAPAPFLLRAPGSPFTMAAGLDQNAVILRGRSDGIAIEIASGRWEDLLQLLSHRLEQTDGFFAGGYVVVDVGTRQLNEAEVDLLGRVLASYALQPGLVRTTDERTFQAALALGIPCAHIGLDGSVINEAMPAQADDNTFPFFVYRGSLRSGQQLYRHEHIMIMGDVNPGAQVASNGDILIWGRLRGLAHAGVEGNLNAIIAALDLDPVQLRIGTVVAAGQSGQPLQPGQTTANGPRWGAARTADRRPEIARLVNGRLLIETWDDVKTTGAPLLKRRRA